jgi:allene oxide cyclase
MSIRTRAAALSGAATIVALAVVAAVPLSAGAARRTARHAVNAGTVTVVEHAVTDTTVFVGGGTKDVTGNLLTFHNQVFNPADTRVVGNDLGVCVRVQPATPGKTPSDGSYTCGWTTFLRGGQITVDGPYYDSKNSVLSITGGTGIYRAARGEMNLISLKGGTEYRFVFHISR